MPSLLIVDDEANIRATLKAALTREGYQTDDAASVAAARDKLREAYDLVLLDVWFPGRTASTCCAASWPTRRRHASS